MIHEQVQKQLDYLEKTVLAELKEKEHCEAWGITYEPSRRKDEDERLYNEYADEVAKNGDKNLLIYAKSKNPNDCMRVAKPFAKRYADDDNHYVHRTEYGSEILCTKDDLDIQINKARSIQSMQSKHQDDYER